jgi:hypothetical protein
MRVCALLGVALGLAVAAGGGVTPAEPDRDATAERVNRLIQQLGHPEFAKREAASKELDAIGEPAFDALRKAATSDRDAEIRRRADVIVQAIAGRIREALAKKELATWQGEWAADGGQKFTVKGDQWASSTPTFGPVSGTLKGIEVRGTMTLVDLVVEAGPTTGHICRTILRRDGDTLHYCGTYDAAHATEFKSQGNNVYIAWKRANNAAARPAAPPAPVQFDGGVFTTDLPMPESPVAVHRVALKVQPADGGTGTLTLDPNLPKLDEFGDPVAGGNPLPVVTLDCTLKLIKKDKERQLFEIRGPKIVSRLALVAYKDTMPWGDARLLVYGKDKNVRYAIDLSVPQQHFPPCHPGCFPAGTPVRVSGGTKPIERVRDGDLVITVDADGQPSPAKVTGVFRTRNRVLEVRVDGAKLVTTETQPVALDGGGVRPAGELKAGDRVWRWVDGKRRGVNVLEVSAVGRDVEVFNLVLGEPKTFIAGDFIVRSKPPADAVRP